MHATEVQAKIIEDHEEIRVLLREVGVVADSVAAGTGDVGRLRVRGRLLHRRLVAHLDFEDRHLHVPWQEADERVLQVSEDHGEQRELLEYVLTQIEDRNRLPSLLAGTFRGFVDVLLADMTREEVAVLPGNRR